ncbi:DUF4282 domain-containing protein [Bacillus thermotolerans]|uniref:Membrane protein n=1 Tax=Bacillus thermotolerans TaxID=1221996 RepID=A0A0F5I6I3_BACTR|nr:DUF4282 domain-containing protein [Bacillus thermotolerans]KKB36202.1 putative membrane protein [Bacillus thermotolerans]KKB41244.1 putative membrane protein [Bacillus thermotolerans]
MSSLTSFDRMITPAIIKIIFWIGVVASIIWGIVLLASGGGAGAVITGLLTIILGPIAVRVYCELLIISFKIYDSLRHIERKVSHRKGADS